MGNPETLARLETQETGLRQTNATLKTRKMSNTDPAKNWE